MNLSRQSFISPNLIIGEIAKKSGDSEFEYDSEGYYMSLIQAAMEELTFDTLFLELSKTYEIDGCRELELPEGAFNVRDIFGHGERSCTIENASNIWFKRNYRSGVARDTWSNNGDPFYTNRSSGRPPGSLYFCGIVNGVIHLSESCLQHKYITVFYNGLLANIGESPVVPMFFRKAIVDYCVVECLSARIASTKENDMLNKWQFVYAHHKESLRDKYDGSWEKARRRAKKLDKKARKDIQEYFSKLRD